MTERWKRELDKLGHVPLGQENLLDRAEHGPRMAREEPRAGSRVLAGIVAFAVFLAGGYGVWAAFGPRSEPVAIRGGSSAADSVVALWPEQTLTDVEAAQERVDQGNDPWRLDPVDTVTTFATEVLGWRKPELRDPAVDELVVEETVDSWTVVISTDEDLTGEFSFAPDVADVDVTVERVGEREGGVWSVIAVSSSDLRDGFTLEEKEGGAFLVRGDFAAHGGSVQLEAPRCDPADPSTLAGSSEPYWWVEGNLAGWIGFQRVGGCDGGAYVFFTIGSASSAGRDPIQGGSTLTSLGTVLIRVEAGGEPSPDGDDSPGGGGGSLADALRQDVTDAEKALDEIDPKTQPDELAAAVDEWRRAVLSACEANVYKNCGA
jgi:hypothetical protein